jgi:hypothetical protein
VVVLVAHSARSVITVPVERGPGGVTSYTGAMRRRVARRALATALRRDRGVHRDRVAERIGRRFSAKEPA